MLLPSRSAWLLGAVAAVLALAPRAARAHGGDYQSPPPVEDPTGGRHGAGGGKGPGTGGGGVSGPDTSGGPAGRTRDDVTSVPAADHWTRWWYANRAGILRSARAERAAVRTGAVESPAEPDEAWRAAARAALVEALSDPSEDVASAAAIGLGKAADPAVARELLAVLVDDARQQPVREAAALALGLLTRERGDAPCPVRRQLEELASDPAEPTRLRAAAVYALGMRADPASVPFLADAARAEEATFDVAAAGATALGLAGAGLARGDLEELLAGPARRRSRPTVPRVYAAHGLARLGDPEAVPALRDAAQDDDPRVRGAAVLALSVVASKEDRHTRALLLHVLSRDRDRACRNMAALALGRLGATSAEDALRRAYRKGESLHVPFAALALGMLARESGDLETTALLRRDLAERGNSDLRGALCVALGLAGDREAIPALREIATARGDPDLRGHAALALGLLGDADSGPLLREVLGDTRLPALQRETATALGLIGDAEAVETLLALVKSSGSVHVQGSAAVALGRIGGARSGAALIEAVGDQGRPAIARGMAAVALGLLLDRSEGRALSRVGADLNWYVLTPTVSEILTIL